MSSDQAAYRHKLARWEIEVRDPANAAAEEPVVYSAGGARAEYVIAPVPSGWSYRCNYRFADYTGGAAPWETPVATRAEAVEAAQRRLLARVSDDRPGGTQLQALIVPDQSGLF